MSRGWQLAVVCALWGAAVVAASTAAGCSSPTHPTSLADPVFDLDTVQQDYLEVVTCKHSHEHELRHVRVFADPVSADIYQRCVLMVPPTLCTETQFPVDSTFVKIEYEFAGCNEADLDGYTATLRLDNGTYPEGVDWHWQRLDPDLNVTQDGAPSVCITCHLDHCAAPYGMDMRCRPD